jgi:cell wall-associated NlpC family hydrolase
VPRTSHEQFLAAERVPIAAALPGDLVFFGRGGRVSHVGIYLGDERFIHAPEAGQSVKISSMAEGWYRARFAGAGRFR